MPIRIPDALPAAGVLRSENVFVMPKSRALHQNIRPMQLVILNLMPKKIETENQLLRLLSNTPLQVDVELLRIDSRVSKNTPQEHIEQFYDDFERIRHKNYDGLIITGAPLGTVPFEDVFYWDQIKEIIEWSKSHVTSTMFLCWAAQAALKIFYGMEKQTRTQKLSGVFRHKTHHHLNPLVRGFDDDFNAPLSRFAEFDAGQIRKYTDLDILADNEQAGVYLAASKDFRQVYVTGHPEYGPKTLHEEYLRDSNEGLEPAMPDNYYPDNDPTKAPLARWRSHGNLLYSNWLNYFVYQITPYQLDDVSEGSLTRG